MAERATRRYPHGGLDLMAAALLLRTPELTRADIARELGCSAKSLMNTAKYPRLARAWGMIKAKKWDYYWSEHQPDRRRRGGIKPDIDDDQS
jgi:hypothetical protein